MTAKRGVATVPALLLTAVLGAAGGIGAYTFHYANGSSYMTDDAAACGHCHVMAGHYDGWRRGPHHAVATCNDCHTPSSQVARYAVKAMNGWHHSEAFTTGSYPAALTMRASSRAVVEGQCRSCHADLVAAMDGEGVSCVRCHDSVGHLR